MARNKKVQDLSEDKSVRSVKLQLHRFSKFLRYLKENDAVIQLNVESGMSGQRFKQIYTAGKRDGNPSIDELVVAFLKDERFCYLFIIWFKYSRPKWIY
ncbi:MAG: hypothetical protein WD607_08620 [Candidatus Paceibacterota bacterium]